MPAFTGSYWFLSLAILACIAVAIGGLLIVRKLVPHDVMEPHHHVAGYLLSVIGTIYAVVLGFIVVDALNTFQNARVVVQQEADALHDIFQIAYSLPRDKSYKIRRLCVEYAQSMVVDEWKAMQDGQGSDRAHYLVVDLWNTVTSYEPVSQGQADLHGAILDQLDKLGDARHARLLEASPDCNPVLLGILVLGGAIVVAFTYFFGVEKLATQVAMTVLVTLVLCLNLVIVDLFGTPFSGDVQVSPHAFEQDQHFFFREMKDEGR